MGGAGKEHRLPQIESVCVVMLGGVVLTGVTAQCSFEDSAVAKKQHMRRLHNLFAALECNVYFHH